MEILHLELYTPVFLDTTSIPHSREEVISRYYFNHITMSDEACYNPQLCHSTVLFYCVIKMLIFSLLVVFIQFSYSVMSDSLWPHGLQHTRLPCPSLNPQNLLKLMSIELVVPSNHLILCHPLLLLPSVFPSIRVFSSESVLRIRWPEY